MQKICKEVVIVNSRNRAGRNLPRVPNPVVTIYRAMENFVSFLPSCQNFMPQILTSTGY